MPKYKVFVEDWTVYSTIVEAEDTSEAEEKGMEVWENDVGRMVIKDGRAGVVDIEQLKE